MRIKSTSLLLLLLCVSAAAAQNGSAATEQLGWEPPSTTGGLFENAKPTSHRDLLSHFDLSGLSIRLENTLLSDVQKRLGGTIGHRGDASESLHWLCFRGDEGHLRWVLWLESAEINGGSIGSFKLHVIPPSAAPDKRCKLARGLRLPLGLQLGMTRKEVIGAFGKASVKRNDELLFLSVHRETIRDEIYDSTNSVRVVLHEGRASEIEAWKTTSS